MHKLTHKLKELGWRLASRTAGFLPILLGLISLVLPAAESSLGLFWSIAAIIWGIVFIVASELILYYGLDSVLYQHNFQLVNTVVTGTSLLL